MNLILNLIRKNWKVNLFAFVTIFSLTIVFAITLGGGRGYHKIYKDVGGKGILAVFEGNVACPYISLVPEDYVAAILKIPHVADVAGEVRQRYTYGKDKNLTLTSMEPDKLLEFKDLEISERAFESFRNQRQGALVGKKIYDFFDWKVGQLVHSAGLIFEVASVFEQPLSVYESMVILHKEYLQGLTSKKGYVTSFLVKTDLKQGQNKEGVIRGIEALFKDHPSKIVCRPEEELWLAIKASQGNLGDIILAIGIALGILLGILHINNAFLTFKHKREKLRALKNQGLSRASVASLMFWETAVVSALSGILAGVTAYLALIKHPYVGSDMFHPPIYIDLQVVVVVMLVSLFSGGLAALVTIPGILKAYEE
ncbi:MAG: FtsX-like permease family protein [Desulfobacterales bacterium]|nr:FtsX-like permease family protein [Desulfobacterales bacterium]